MQMVVYKYFEIYNFDEIDLVTAIVLTEFVNDIYNKAKKVIYSLNTQEQVKQKKSAFDDYDKEEDEKYGIKVDESKEYYSTVNKYIISLERYCRQKKIDINVRIDFLIDNIRDEMEYDEEHKDDYKDL